MLFTLRPSDFNFKFGNTVTSSLGIVTFRFPCPYGGSIDMYMGVTNLDVPLLLCLRELRSHLVLVDYLKNTLHSRLYGWTTKLEDKFGHLYWNLLTSESFYTQAEIEILHKHFFQPSAKNLYDLLRWSEIGQATEDLKNIIDSVIEALSLIHI